MEKLTPEEVKLIEDAEEKMHAAFAIVASVGGERESRRFRRVLAQLDDAIGDAIGLRVWGW